MSIFLTFQKTSARKTKYPNWDRNQGCYSLIVLGIIVAKSAYSGGTQVSWTEERMRDYGDWEEKALRWIGIGNIGLLKRPWNNYLRSRL
jgi:hypothetical protein